MELTCNNNVVLRYLDYDSKKNTTIVRQPKTLHFLFRLQVSPKTEAIVGSEVSDFNTTSKWSVNTNFIVLLASSLISLALVLLE